MKKLYQYQIELVYKYLCQSVPVILPVTMNILEIVTIDKYPITNTNTTEYAEFLKKTRARYLEDGVVVLPNFLTDEAIKVSVREVSAAKGEEWMTNSSHNVFLDQGSTEFHKNHIRFKYFSKSGS